MAVRHHEFDDDREESVQQAKRSRITIDMSPELRRKIKVAAAQNDVTVGEYLHRIIEAALPDETSTIQYKAQPITRGTLKRVFEVREKILQHTNGYLFENSTETIRQMREERSRELDQL